MPKAGASARPWDLAFLPSPFLSTNILKHFRRFLYLSQKAATRISTWLHNRLKYNDLPTSEDGRVAQLGERVVRNDEVAGSNPVTSTNFYFSTVLVLAGVLRAVRQQQGCRIRALIASA